MDGVGPRRSKIDMGDAVGRATMSLLCGGGGGGCVSETP